MKEKFTSLILIFMLIFSTLHIAGQNIMVGDSIILNALDYVAGGLQWQYSFNNEEWFDMEEGNGLTHVFFPERDTYLRLRINDPDCMPAYYTEVRFIEVEGAFTCGDTLTDLRDGQSYPTVLIGKQCWMARNLNIGDMVRGNENQSDTAVIQKYCYGNSLANCDKYGGLYQWDQAMEYSSVEGIRGICPPGWHLPADEEWILLEKELNMPEEELYLIGFRGSGIGDALKVGGSTGFDALFAGARNHFGTFQFIEGSTSFEFGYFYSSTQAEDKDFAFRRCLRKDDSGFGRFDTWPKLFGLSVRCVKDE